MPSLDVMSKDGGLSSTHDDDVDDDLCSEMTDASQVELLSLVILLYISQLSTDIFSTY